MSDNKVSVEESTIGRDFIGRDHISYTINSYSQNSKYLEQQYEKYQKEISSDVKLKEICDDLNHYRTPLKNEDVTGLENKLIAGNKSNMFEYASEVKERFHKKLLKYSQYSEIAQEINVHLLAMIRRTFVEEVYPLIYDGKPDEYINQYITERIVNHVKTELGSNLFRYNDDEIMGMIYFLTGNCHLKWS